MQGTAAFSWRRALINPGPAGGAAFRHGQGVSKGYSRERFFTRVWGLASSGPSYRTSMRFRSGVYIVPTDQWYIERTVWLIAGIVLLISTALAALVDRLWILVVIATALSSIVVALTGFCVVGNVLHRLGFQAKLATPPPTFGDLYFMQTDRWYLERRIYLAVGINLTVASILSLLHSSWWLAFTGFVGVAMVWFSATGF